MYVHAINCYTLTVKLRPKRHYEKPSLVPMTSHNCKLAQINTLPPLYVLLISPTLLNQTPANKRDSKVKFWTGEKFH